MSKKWFLVSMSALAVVGAGLTGGAQGIGIAMLMLSVCGLIFAPLIVNNWFGD